MKKNLSLISVALIGIFLVAGSARSQGIFKATAYYGSTTTSIIVVLRPNFNFNDKLNEVGFAIQVPKLVSGVPIALPTFTVLNNFLATTFPTGTWEGYISESVSDANFYNFKFGATAFSAPPILTVPSGTELQVIELQISVSPAAIPLLRLAHLASGGPSSQYGVAFIDGSLVDRTDYSQMFYGTGSIPLLPAADPTAGYNTYQYVSPSAALLPVKFLGFTVIKKNNDAILTWQIENETGLTDRYEVERSLNGTDFKNVNTITPKNNGLSSNTYDITDFNLATLRAAGILYYRIKQFDKDGNFVYSPTKSVRLNSKGIVIGVYPNPFRELANVTIDMEQDSDATITITDANGKQLQNIQTQLFKGPNRKPINMQAFAAGSYLLKVQTPTETKTLSVVKTN